IKILILMLVICSVSAKAQEVVKDVTFDADYYDSGNSDQYGIIVLTGSAGGKANDTSANLAALGYNVLALSYFDRDGSSIIPETLEMIPLEYLEAPRRWLAARTKGVVLYGLSKGAEFALAAASYDDDYIAVIALAPSKVVWQGIPKDFSTVAKAPSSWSRNGKGLSFVPYLNKEEQEKTGIDNRHQASLTNVAAAEKALIKVENISIPLLLLSGGKVSHGLPQQWLMTFVQVLEITVPILIILKAIIC
ncbi:MAG: hypothetical protein HOM01_04290, partial [Kordiimonadaceae bacterium]|nr:hypothetical protein [Kordiimonadaceae bacterium]